MIANKPLHKKVSILIPPPGTTPNKRKKTEERKNKSNTANSRLRNHIPQVRPVKLVTHLHHALIVNLPLRLHAAGVDLQNLKPPHLVRQRNLNLAVQPAGPQQRRVERVRSVRGHDDLRLAEVVETVELVEQLHERALDLAVGRGALRKAPAADGVDLVHEDDARLVLLGVAEHLADEPGGLADIFVDDGGCDDCKRVIHRQFLSYRMFPV